MARRVWALTGTPGTGKSTVASRLQAHGWTVVAVDTLLNAPGAITGRDHDRGSSIVNPAALAPALVRRLRQVEGDVVVEGHLAHDVPGVTHALVLRLRPSVLARRLGRRGWTAAKVQENVEAEAVSVVAGEALDAFEPGRAFEADVTGLRRSAAASLVEAILRQEPDALVNAKIGRVEWSAEILRWY